MRARLRAPGLLAALLVAAGCSSYEVNPELKRIDYSAGYRLENIDTYPHPKNSENIFFVLTLSGGGTRAAALAFGAMQHLEATAIGGDRTLLDEVDVISSVSGGSFAAAYYGLFGKDEFFRGFHSAVLNRKIQRSLIVRVLAPWNWPRLLSPKFGRSDLLNRYYAREIFGERSYADLPRHTPVVVINAADVSLGSYFSFVQEHFDLLCSDLDGVQVSRAVLSSSAFPGAFTPLTFKNYNVPGESCGYAAPDWVDVSFGTDEACRQDHDCRGNLEANPRQFDLARNFKSYEDASSRPFIHLVDGGVADNIGLRGPISWIVFGEGREWSVLSQVSLKEVDRVIVLVVDAKPRKRPAQDLKASPPNVISVLSAAASRPMANFSTDTVELLRNQIDQWEKDGLRFERQRKLCDRAAASRCEGDPCPEECLRRERERCYQDFRLTDAFRPPQPSLHRIHVRFDALRDEELRQRLQELPTTLQLPPDDVEALITAAATLLEDSEAYRDLVRELRAPG